MTEIMYFGCWGTEIGHYLGAPGHRAFDRSTWAEPKGFPFPGGRDLDGVYPPHGRAEHEPRYNGDTYHTTSRDLQTEGVAKVAHVKGWTVMAFWDRSVDGRYASNSAFVARGFHDFAAMVEIAGRVFPEVWDRFEFEVVERER